MSRLIAAFCVIALGVLLGAPALAAGPVQIRVTGVDASAYPDVRLVASITDAAGKPVDGLRATDVLISEDGRPQRAGLERVGEKQPLALVLALDVSGSMAGKPLADAKAALNVLVGSLAAGDSAAFITFNTAVSVDQSLTTNKAALTAAIGRAVANGNTAIFDAESSALDLLASADPRARRAIVLLTDGEDNSSRVALATVNERMHAQTFPLYVVGLGTSLNNATLQSLANAGTGGGLYIAPSSAQLAAIYAALAQEIRVQYTIGYRSDATRAPEGSSVTSTLQVVQAGAVLGTATISFTVPAGHGIVPAAPTTDVRIPSTALLPPEGSPANPVIPGLLGAATTLCLLLWVSTLLETQGLFALERERLSRYAGVERTVQPARRSFWARAVRPTLLRLAAPFGRWAPRSMVEGTRRRLNQSGGALEMGAAEFIGLRIGLAFVFGVAALAVAAMLNPVAEFVALIALAGLLFGYLIPGIWLDRTVRGRQHRMLRALPAALDMLALAAGAGMTLDGALGQVAQRWRGPLSDEFRRLLVEFNMGRDRRTALRALGERTGVPEIARFVNAIIQADALGTPISRVLQEQAVEMRTRRRQRAEEAARKAPVKMLFPMVGLIFPALFVVILGPAVPRFMDLFQQVR